MVHLDQVSCKKYSSFPLFKSSFDTTPFLMFIFVHKDPPPPQKKNIL